MLTQQILDSLQALVERSGRMPGLGKKAVDERRFYALLGQFREALPADLREAARVSQEKERILSEARAEAEQVRAQARQAAAELVRESEITRQAREGGEEIVRQARAEAQEIQKQARAYGNEVLEKIDSMVSRIAAAVEAGRAALSSSDSTE